MWWGLPLADGVVGRPRCPRVRGCAWWSGRFVHRARRHRQVGPRRAECWPPSTRWEFQASAGRRLGHVVDEPELASTEPVGSGRATVASRPAGPPCTRPVRAPWPDHRGIRTPSTWPPRTSTGSASEKRTAYGITSFPDPTGHPAAMSALRPRPLVDRELHALGRRPHLRRRASTFRGSTPPRASPDRCVDLINKR